MVGDFGGNKEEKDGYGESAQGSGGARRTGPHGRHHTSKPQESYVHFPFLLNRCLKGIFQLLRNIFGRIIEGNPF